MALGPVFKLGDTLEACLFIQSRRLEIVAGYPDPADTSTACLGDERLQQCARVTASSTGLVDPHLFQLGDVRPGMAGDGGDRLSGLIPDYEAQTSTIVSSGGPAVVLVKAFFDGVDLIRGEIVPGLDLKNHDSRATMDTTGYPRCERYFSAAIRSSTAMRVR